MPVPSVLDSLQLTLSQKALILDHAAVRIDSLVRAVPDTVFHIASPAGVSPAPLWAGALPTVIGGILAITGGILAQAYRAHVEQTRARARILARTRYTLAVVNATAVATAKKDETHSINPEVMNGILVEWSRYDRVSDDADLLNDPALQAEIDALLSHSRRVAEKVIEDEGRFRETLRDVGRQVDPSISREIQSHRKRLLSLVRGLDERSRLLLIRLDKKWPPSAGGEGFGVPLAVEDKT